MDLADSACQVEPRVSVLWQILISTPLEQLNQFEKVLTWLRVSENRNWLRLSVLWSHLDFHAMKARSYLSRRTLSADRWALCGESAFFVDALYSPGGDFIAVG